LIFDYGEQSVYYIHRMTQSEIFNNINLNESFPHLSKAPITEAIIEIRGRASVPWNEDTICAELKRRLPDYPKHRSGRAKKIQWNLQKEPNVAVENLGWKGIRFTSTDEKQIATFNIDSFALSRLQPYEDWKRFTREAKRLWEIHTKVAHPIEIQRLGVRFINRIELSREKIEIRDYFNGFSPAVPEILLDINSFLHHDVLSVPGYPYMVNIIKTIQPQSPNQGSALILDIDAYTQEPFEPNSNAIDQKLLFLHWLKNKIFFSIITPQIREQYK
jgi:uncharacterized protein (TIGR04255 family)